ncbi:MAG: protein-glutamate O-methyltransferase CheR [Phycisphaerales bacterium]
MKPTPQDMKLVSALVMQLCGIVIGETKDYLVESRLGPFLREAGHDSYAKLCQAVAGNPALKQRFIDAMTTNETLFFRDDAPFDVLQHRVIPMVFDEKSSTPSPRRLRIWSAACSTGQEPYSLSMILHELVPDIRQWDIRILATDISERAISAAQTGVYSELEIGRGLPDQLRRKYFKEDAGQWRITDNVRSIINFRRLNLLTNFAALGQFDIVLCRNVAIYFDADVQKDLFQRLAKVLSPSGYMFVGASESLAKFGPMFVPQMHCRATYYQPNLTEPPKRMLA